MSTHTRYLLGVTTNTPGRTMDSVMPFLGLSTYFRFFNCAQDANSEKPEQAIFDRSLNEMNVIAKQIIENGTVDRVEKCFIFNTTEGGRTSSPLLFGWRIFNCGKNTQILNIQTLSSVPISKHSSGIISHLTIEDYTSFNGIMSIYYHPNDSSSPKHRWEMI